MPKALKITGKVILIVLGVIIAFLVLVRVGEKAVYANFYTHAKREFKIPGLSDGFVPQGLDFEDSKGVYLTCGYSTNGASRVYSIDADGKSVRTDLKKGDGADYTGHTGGIAHFGDFVYITGDDGLDVFRLSDVLSGGGTAEMIGEVKTGNDPAYCHVRDGYIYVGTFYRAGNYETPENERITTPSGDENTSVILVFRLSEDAELGIDPTPVEAYSAPGLVQGMCFDDVGRIVLSTSYGFATSHLYFYENSRTGDATYEIGENEVPLYFLDSSNLVKTVKAPPMSEEIILDDGRILIMTESASNKYIFGKLMSGRHIFGYKPE